MRLKATELDMKAVEMARSMFPNDQRMMHLCQEKMATILTNQKLIGGPKPPASVSELMESTGAYTTKVILKKRSAVGRMVAKRYRDEFGEPGTTQKFCNGHTCNVKVYPEQHQETIQGWVSEYMSSSE